MVKTHNMSPSNFKAPTMTKATKTFKIRQSAAVALVKVNLTKSARESRVVRTSRLTNRQATVTTSQSIISAAMFLWPIISGLLFSNAQYSSPLLAAQQAASTSAFCDSSRLVRCQQDILKDIQLVVLNAASVQYPISQGPPYSPAAKLREQQQQQQQQQRIATPGTCRLVRSNLDCILLSTPTCYENGLQSAAQSGDIALRAKRFLEQNNCNDPDTSWQVTFCYRAPEIRTCEERYGFTAFSTMIVNSTSCLSYQAFKFCVEAHLRINCKVHEIDMSNEYLIDRAGDLAWRCPVNSSASANLHYGSLHNPYALSNPSSAILSPSSYGHNSNYEQRPTYVGSSNNLNLFSGSVREQPWERYRNPYDDVRDPTWERYRTPYNETRYGISRLPGGGIGGSGEVFDRLVASGGVGSSFDSDLGDCPVKAAPYARECEDTLVDQQRLARDSRDGNELQRRICCSLYQYRDCVSRVVLDRCADSSPAAVEVLMGVRRREMVLTCRGYNRDLCSGALANAVANPLLLLVASLFASYIALKQQGQR